MRPPSAEARPTRPCEEAEFREAPTSGWKTKSGDVKAARRPMLRPLPGGGLVAVLRDAVPSVRIVNQRRVALASPLRWALPVARPPQDLLGLRLVVVSPEPLALAGGHQAHFVSPGVAVGALQLDPLGPGVSRDAAVFRRVAPPPLAAADGVGHEVGGEALARAHQLLDGLGAAAGSVSDVAGGAQLPAAQLRGTWVGKTDIGVRHRGLGPTQTLRRTGGSRRAGNDAGGKKGAACRIRSPETSEFHSWTFRKATWAFPPIGGDPAGSNQLIGERSEER